MSYATMKRDWDEAVTRRSAPGYTDNLVTTVMPPRPTQDDLLREKQQIAEQNRQRCYGRFY